MIIDTYQSGAVMRILQRGEVYWAKPSISFKGEYAALIDMLGLHCECPIFGVVHGRKQNTGGAFRRGAHPAQRCRRNFVGSRNTAWVDFMSNFKYTSQKDYRTIIFSARRTRIRRCTSA